MPKRRRCRPLVWLAVGGIFLLCGLCQNLLPLWLPVWCGRPLFLVPLCVVCGMCGGTVAGMAAGTLAAVLWSTAADAPFGVYALLLAAIGCTAGQLVERLLRNNALVLWLLCSGAVVGFGIADCLCLRLPYLGAGALSFWWHTTLPNMLCTWVLGLPLCVAVWAIAGKTDSEVARE